MPPIALFLVFVLILAAALFAVWRYWMSLARVSPEQEEFDERVAALNERQANRISDKFLAQPFNEDDAWQIMVRRGRRLGPRQRRRRETPARSTQPRLLPPRQPEPRRDRYGGDLSRRVDERRDRQADPARRPRRTDED